MLFAVVSQPPNSSTMFFAVVNLYYDSTKIKTVHGDVDSIPWNDAPRDSVVKRRKPREGRRLRAEFRGHSAPAPRLAENSRKGRRSRTKFRGRSTRWLAAKSCELGLTWIRRDANQLVDDVTNENFKELSPEFLFPKWGRDKVANP